MAVITVDQTYNETSRMDIHSVAREFNEALGPTLVAVLAGVRDRKLPGKWAKPGGVEPRDESQRRLTTAARVEVAVEVHGRPCRTVLVHLPEPAAR